MTTRRNLATAAGAALAVLGMPTIAGAGSPPASPIVAAGRRLNVLIKLDETEANLDEQFQLSDFVTDSTPTSVADAAILLMAAATAIGNASLQDDGTTEAEHGEIMVRRVAHFLAGLAGIDLNEAGGAYYFTDHERAALSGTVRQAAKRYFGVDEAERQRRHDEYHFLLCREVILARLKEARSAALDPDG